MTNLIFPPLLLDEWKETRDTIKTYADVLGKIRRALTPRQKHWWHISLRAATTGLTTTPIPTSDKTFSLLLDFTDHQLVATTNQGDWVELPLEGQSAAEFYDETMTALQQFDINPGVDREQFSDDTPGTYDDIAAFDMWQALSQIDVILKEFKGDFRKESSPVQLWPHHFDMAVVWFSGRLVPGVDPDDEEYADEQMNFGFSTGDTHIPDAYFYATAYPTPDGLTAQPLPADAYWHTEGFTGAIMMYESLVTAENPKEKLLNFLRTTHKAGATLMT